MDRLANRRGLQYAAQHPELVADQGDIGHEETLQNRPDTHHTEPPGTRHGDEHEHPATGQRHFQNRERPWVNLEHPGQQRVRFNRAVRKQRQREERIRDAEQQDRQRQEQQVGLVPVDEILVLAGAPSASVIASSDAGAPSAASASSPLMPRLMTAPFLTADFTARFRRRFSRSA